MSFAGITMTMTAATLKIYVQICLGFCINQIHPLSPRQRRKKKLSCAYDNVSTCSHGITEGADVYRVGGQRGSDENRA